jgi:hypothetical protein
MILALTIFLNKFIVHILKIHTILTIPLHKKDRLFLIL